MNLIAADTHYLVVGLGLTGLSCVRYLAAQGKLVSVIDSRACPPGLDALSQTYPDVSVYLDGFDADVLASADVLVMSPGVALSTPEIQAAINAGARVTSDIELFLGEFKGQVIAITGSNAKSTVTQWLGEAIALSGRRTLIAGNIGRPVLDAAGEHYDVAVLELSSFQLELIPRLNAAITTILNVSEDHMDRYDSMAHYIQAKQKIYFGTSHAVFNRDDILTQPLVPDHVKTTTFGLGEPDLNQYGLRVLDGVTYLACGLTPIVEEQALSLQGRHNTANALAVLALADALGVDRSHTIEALKNFSGLPYRCQLIKSVNGIRYFNDSKATNVGSTIAALHGLSTPSLKNIILLMGGQSKGQDLSPLAPVVKSTCKRVLVFGEDQALIQAIVTGTDAIDTMEQGLQEAKATATKGDIVLLSPACASFDQFKNFEDRGRVFNEWVEANV